MTMEAVSSLRYVIAGQLKRDFALLPDGKALVNVAGGNLGYAAAGLGVWQPARQVGLVARVGEDYPQEWLAEMHKRGYDRKRLTCVLFMSTSIHIPG
jgi:hypothetical protein